MKHLSFSTTVSLAILIMLGTAGYFSIFIYRDQLRVEASIRQASDDCVRLGGKMMEWTDGGPHECWLSNGTTCGLGVKGWLCPTSQVANPASVNCVTKGGLVDIRTGTDSGQVGYCVFSDSSECEEWALFRGECNAGSNPNDKRILLTSEVIHQLGDKLSMQQMCDFKFNTDSANAFVAFSNKDKGISLQIPYNENWGTKDYKLSPFDLTDKQLNFGSMTVFEGCSWPRYYTISFLSVKTPTQISQEIIKYATQEGQGVVGLLPVPPTTITINGLTVVKYETSGLCNFPALQVIGKKYNYNVTSVCNGNFKELENIVKTIKLID